MLTKKEVISPEKTAVDLIETCCLLRDLHSLTRKKLSFLLATITRIWKIQSDAFELKNMVPCMVVVVALCCGAEWIK